jgi:uncharacterized coiled-coil protein SlyX
MMWERTSRFTVLLLLYVLLSALPSHAESVAVPVETLKEWQASLKKSALLLKNSEQTIGELSTSLSISAQTIEKQAETLSTLESRIANSQSAIENLSSTLESSNEILSRQESTLSALLKRSARGYLLSSVAIVIGGILGYLIGRL